MTEELPLVSIIIPVYNGERYIRQCLESLVTQRYPNKEIIVVDDGSTDNTAEVVKQVEGNIRYIKQPNAGSAVARNTGLDNAKGEFIAFNDGDDLWAPNRLHQQVKFLQEHPEYGVATGRFTHVDAAFTLADATPVDESEPLEIIQERSGWVYHTLFETSWYHIIAALVRREVIEKVRFVPEYRRGQDFDFWLQLAHHTQVAQLSSNYAYYRKNEDSISHQPAKKCFRYEIMVNALATMGDKSQSGEQVTPEQINRYFHKCLFEHGYELFLAKWYKKALKAFWQARRYQPFRFDSYKFIIRCLLSLPFDKSPAQ